MKLSEMQEIPYVPSRAAESKERYKRKCRTGTGVFRKYRYEQYTMLGEYIRSYDTLKEVIAEGFSSGSISNACNGTSKSHKGYKWKKIKLDEDERDATNSL